MPNRLAHESSPYLLQHQHNPVDWHPWGPEALERARQEDRAIFLSIGYSACHWCHVMEHESFENPEIAALMNELFINIKVDREERPDLDQIYMNAVQLMTGHGGWPMSVFLTPDLRPFFGGTYFPPRSRQGLPGFDQVLRGVHDAWTNRRPDALAAAERLTEALQELAAGAGLGEPAGVAGDQRGMLQPALVTDAARSLERSFDFTHGGFGGAPKFPHAMDLRVLLRVWKRHSVAGALDMVRLTLDKMAAGGLYDHLGGGFHRYSVDARWLVPHFEKMLYDNALLAGCYVEAAQATGEAEYERVARETLDFVLREMTDPAGGFYSTQDADCEGEEGKFYVWSPAETAAVLGAAAGATFNRVFDVTERGNFEGHNILNLPKTLAQQAQLLGLAEADLRRELAASKAKLYDVRRQRVPPGLDDKVLVSWNALAIEALAMAGAAFGEPRYTSAAAKAADFILRDLRRADGRLLHSWRHGKAKFDAYLDAYLDDYAYLAHALVPLYEATLDERWITAAVRLAEIVLAQFADRDGGGFFFTAADHEPLIARNKDAHDASVPSASGMAAAALGRLGRLTGRSDFLEAAEGTLALYAPLMHRSPAAAGQLLLALDDWLGPSPELAMVGVPGDAVLAEALAAIHRRFIPGRLVAARTGPPAAGSPLEGLFAGKSAGNEAALYVCQSFACQAPAVGREAIFAEIARL